MASKYSSAVFVTFLLALSLSNASPISSILQLPATLGNIITNNLMLLNKLPIISQMIGGPTTTTSASILHAPVPSTSSQATTAIGGATGTSPGIAAQTSVVPATAAPVNQAPSTVAAAVQPPGGVSEAAVNGDVTATGSSTAAAESPAG